jgi:hypothetical protein
MKKELLIGTALVSTLGAASVAEAVTATMSGNHQTGLEFDSPTGGSDTRAQINDNNFTVSLSETTDGGMTISSSFMLLNEAGGGSSDEDAGFSLAFTDGSKLDVLNAGNASGSHDISIPGSAGAEGVTVTTGNTAPTGLDFMTGSTVYGVEYHSAADFLADGLKMSFSASTDNGAASGATYGMDNHFAFGGTYVTDLGDSAVTVGFGYSDSDGAKTGDQMTADEGGIHVGVSAVTGDLTVAVGFADGDSIESVTASTPASEVDGEVVKVGAKYVTGDLTFNVGVTSGNAHDNSFAGTDRSGEDSVETTSASVSYAVASGVTAILGYSNTESQNEGAADDKDGSAWYIGANMSF